MEGLERQIIVGLVGLLVASWGFFGYLVSRGVAGNDKKLEKLDKNTEDLPAIRKDIEWLKKEVDK